jgi:hypothetical protein
MSAIALKWVAQMKVGNSIAKNLLRFYACHNFGKPGFEFKNKTLAEQLEVSETSIKEAHRLLQEKNLIKRKAQYDKTGRQCATITYLNIPDEFTEDFFEQPKKQQQPVDNLGGEGSPSDGGGVASRLGEGSPHAPLVNNKYLNNKNNIKTESNFNNMYNKNSVINKTDQQKQMNKPKSYEATQQLIQEIRSAKRISPESAKNFFESLPPHLRPKRFQNPDSDEKIQNEAVNCIQKSNETQLEARS